MYNNLFLATAVFPLFSQIFFIFIFCRTESDHMTAAIIATPPVVQSLNRIMCYPEPLTSGPPHAKRSRFPSDSAVLILTDLAPLLTFDPNKCSVLLNLFTKEAGSASQHCQLVSVDLKGAAEGRFQPYLLEDCSTDSGVCLFFMYAEVCDTMWTHFCSCCLDESREDLLSLLVALESWSFRIISTDRTVVDLSRFLEEKFGTKRLKIDPQYLLCHSTQPSGILLFHWKPCSSFYGVLDVYCRSETGFSTSCVFSHCWVTMKNPYSDLFTLQRSSLLASFGGHFVQLPSCFSFH